MLTDKKRSETRRRIVLRVVQRGEATGFVSPSRDFDQVMYRGPGEADYVCGCCGHLLAVGVREGMFPTLAFSCGCGAINVGETAYAPGAEDPTPSFQG